MKKANFLSMVIVLLLASTFISGPPRCQPLEIQDGHKTAMALKCHLPHYMNRDFSGAIIDLSLQTRLSDAITLALDMPFAHTTVSHDYRDYGSTSAEDAVGNFYAGAILRKANTPIFGKLGLFFPTASVSTPRASAAALFSNVQYLESFSPDWLILNAGLGLHTRADSGIVGQLQLESNLWINSDNGYDRSDELIVHYGGSLWYRGRIVNFGCDLAGASILTEDYLFYPNRDIGQAEIGANVNLRNMRPGLFLLFPLDNERNRAVNLVLGLNVQVQM